MSVPMKFAHTLLALAATATLSAGTLVAQDSAAARAPTRAQATRAELEALVAGGTLDATEASRVRQRLTEGDFQPGDRVALTVLDEPTLTDTFTVRTGRVLSLPNLPDIPLKGVLRSETEPYLRGKISQYVKEPDIEATSLIRIAVLGAVNRPGFYFLPAEMLVSDAVMAAEGPSGQADMKKTIIRRGELQLADRTEVHAAIQGGRSLDQMNLQGGDELLIGEKSGGVRGTLQTVGLASGLLLAIAAVARVF